MGLAVAGLAVLSGWRCVHVVSIKQTNISAKRAMRQETGEARVPIRLHDDQSDKCQIESHWGLHPERPGLAVDDRVSDVVCFVFTRRSTDEQVTGDCLTAVVQVSREPPKTPASRPGATEVIRGSSGPPGTAEPLRGKVYGPNGLARSTLSGHATNPLAGTWWRATSSAAATRSDE